MPTSRRLCLDWFRMPTFDPDCTFCEIVRLDDPHVREVYRDEHVVAFFPTEPAALGHTMVVPREHVPDIWSLSEDTAAHLARASIRLAAAVRLAVEPEGLNIIQSNGKVATQTVFHLHVHLLPRWAEDAVGPIWPMETSYSEAAKDQTLAAVRRACGELKQ